LNWTITLATAARAGAPEGARGNSPWRLAAGHVDGVMRSGEYRRNLLRDVGRQGVTKDGMARRLVGMRLGRYHMVLDDFQAKAR